MANATYGIPGLVLVAQSFNELKAAVEKLPEWSLDSKIQDNFLNYIATNFLFGKQCQQIDTSLSNRLTSIVDTQNNRKIKLAD